MRAVPYPRAISRRAMAGMLGSAGVVSAPAAATGPNQRRLDADASHPDAALIALCAEFDALEREFLATDFEADSGTPEGDHAKAEQQRIGDQQAELAERLCGLPVTTLDGARALARTMALNNAELFRDAAPGGYTNDMLLGALVGGLIGWPNEP